MVPLTEDSLAMRMQEWNLPTQAVHIVDLPEEM